MRRANCPIELPYVFLIAFFTLSVLCFASEDAVKNQEFMANCTLERTSLLGTIWDNNATFHVIEDIAYTDRNNGRQMFDIAIPDKVEGKLPLIIWVHGGGFIEGSRKSNNPFQFSENYYALKMGIAVASVDYRLAPVNKYPIQLNDVLSFIEYIKAHAKDYNIDTSKIAIFGHSAGAYLALIVSEVSKDIKCVVSYSGFTDLTNGGDLVDTFVGTCFKKDADLSNASPIFLLNELSPPTLLIHGDADEMISYQQAEAFVRKMNEFKNRGEFWRIFNGTHGYWQGDTSIPMQPSRDEMIERTLKFFYKHLLFENRGDANFDGFVSSDDYYEVLESLGGKGYSINNGNVFSGNELMYNTLADLTMDGVVTTLDLKLMALIIDRASKRNNRPYQGKERKGE